MILDEVIGGELINLTFVGQKDICPNSKYERETVVLSKKTSQQHLIYSYRSKE